MPEDDDNSHRRGGAYLRSHSLPLEPNESWLEGSASELGVEEHRTEIHSSAASMTADARANSPTPCPSWVFAGGEAGRVGVHDFLRLADLLHEKVAESEEGEGSGGGGGEDGGYLLYDYGDTGSGFVSGLGPPEGCVGAGWRENTEANERENCIWELADDRAWSCSGEEDADGGGKSGSGGDSVASEPDLGRANVARVSGRQDIGGCDCALFGQRLVRCGWWLLEEARKAAKIVVGRWWFARAPQVIKRFGQAVCLFWRLLCGVDRTSKKGGGEVAGAR